MSATAESVILRGLFAPESPVVTPAEVAGVLASSHYLGAAKRGFAWSDEFGVLVLGSPSSRSLPHDRWLELTRWCLNGTKNGGSQQWARVWRWLYENRPDITTVVSYSDPGVGHTGALYRACNWLWAPTWLRLRPPPSGNGSWQRGKVETVKDRWVFSPSARCGARANPSGQRCRAETADARGRVPRAANEAWAHPSGNRWWRMASGGSRRDVRPGRGLHMPLRNRRMTPRFAPSEAARKAERKGGEA